MARDEQNRLDPDLAVGLDSVPYLGPGLNRQMEVPLELVYRQDVCPLQRRSNGRLLVPIPAGPARVRPDGPQPIRPASQYRNAYQSRCTRQSGKTLNNRADEPGAGARGHSCQS